MSNENAQSWNEQRLGRVHSEYNRIIAKYDPIRDWRSHRDLIVEMKLVIDYILAERDAARREREAAQREANTLREDIVRLELDAHELLNRNECLEFEVNYENNHFRTTDGE